MSWILIPALALVAWLVFTFNKLVRIRNQSRNAWADIDVQLKRRYDLIPNLVETIKGYAGHEKETFEAVVEARNRAMAAQGPAQKGPAEGQLGQALGSLFALAESYPELRAVDNFLQLQGTLSEIEEALQNARRYYNAVVRDLNTAIEQFPSNLVAGLFGFTPADFFVLRQPSGRLPASIWTQSERHDSTSTPSPGTFIHCPHFPGQPLDPPTTPGSFLGSREFSRRHPRFSRRGTGGDRNHSNPVRGLLEWALPVHPRSVCHPARFQLQASI